MCASSRPSRCLAGAPTRRAAASRRTQRLRGFDVPGDDPLHQRVQLQLRGPLAGCLADEPNRLVDREPTKRRLTWPDGAIATTYSADEPERLRVPQHDWAWCDELASWRSAR